MQKTLLDTDTFSEIIKGKNARIRDCAERYRDIFGRFTISTITIVEVVKGLQRLGRQLKIDLLLKSLALEDVVSLDRDAGALAGRIYGELERFGQPIGRADPMIAATAIQNDIVLATGNTRHFERIVRLGFPLSIVN